jgi:FkbM family methyltransferase
VKSLIKKLGYDIVPGSKDPFHVQQMLLSSIKVKTIFEIGANIGQTVEKYGSVFPESIIYCFEPFQESFEVLHNRFKKNTLIKTFQLAVSNKTGKTRFYVHKKSATNSMLSTMDNVEYWVNANGIQHIKTIEVPVTTIDTFCQQELINEIQILKMDIQGGELMALEGAIEKLSRRSISLIYTEITFVPIYKGQAQFHQICSFLFNYDYTLFDMYNLNYARNGQLKWCDAIFISPQVENKIA